MKKIILIYIILLLSFEKIFANEFLVTVSVNTEKLTNSLDREVLSDLESQIINYIQMYNWTDDPTFERYKIVLNINIIIETTSGNGRYAGQFNINAARTIFGSGNLTTLIRHTDRTFDFEFQSGFQIRHDEQNYEALASFLDFYMYFILGIEADSYDPLAGQIYFGRAARIATLPGNNMARGWLTSTTNDAKKQLVDEYMDVKFNAFRNGFFKYHHDGLDALVLDAREAYQNMVDGIRLIDETDRKFPNSQWKRRFFEAKSREIAEILSNAPPEIKETAYKVLTRVDPSSMTIYGSLQ